MIRVKLIWILSAILACLCQSILAQQTAPADLASIERTDLQQIQTEAATRREREENRRPDDISLEGDLDLEDRFSPPKGGACFAIHTVDLTGYEDLGTRPDIADQLVGTCATAADIGTVLNQLNRLYQDAGLITTRAYAPQQDVSDGSLEISIISGRIEGYVYGSGAPQDARIALAFPAKRGEVLNLRDLEQGLENMNGPASVNATFDLVPGEDVGGSYIQVKTEETKPWHLSFGLSNAGFESTGKYKGRVSLTYDNLFNRNDEISIGFNNSPFEDRSDLFSDSYSASFNLPVGNWSLFVDLNKSEYFYILDGINETYPIEGNSASKSFVIENLISRNQSSKTYSYASLTLSRSQVFISDVEIESQRRRLTIGSTGLRGETAGAQAKLTWDIGLRFGLSWFGADVLEDSLVDPKFQVLKFRTEWQRPIGQSGLSFESIVAGQHSGSILPGSEQISIGGWSTVRGFHDDSMYGDSGIYFQNTLQWTALKTNWLQIGQSLGVDYGYISPSELRDWSRNSLWGAMFGTDITFNNQAVLSLKWGRALRRPESSLQNSEPGFEGDLNVYMADFSIDF